MADDVMQPDKPCCTPKRNVGGSSAGPVESLTRDDDDVAKQVKYSIPPIPVAAITAKRGGLGTDHPLIKFDGESPYRKVRIKPYHMMTTAVTNEMFAAFVAETGYVTEAERFGWSYVFYANVPVGEDNALAPEHAEWWRRIEGACWHLVGGPGSKGDYDPDHPVVHVSWNDARAFAEWAGGRLPTEVEWEHAARGGLGDVWFPWGDREPDDTGFQPCNIWQGSFPYHNTVIDGFVTTAPAQSFQPNGYGLYNMCGNVWEWTAQPYRVRSLSKKYKDHARRLRGTKVLKGGSFLCHKSYCFRYRIAARTATTPDSTTAHQGFRLVFDA